MEISLERSPDGLEDRSGPKSVRPVRPAVSAAGALVSTIDLTLPPDETVSAYRPHLPYTLSQAVFGALIALIGLNLLDVVTTRWVLSLGAHHGMRAVESDPLSKALLGGFRVELVKIGLLAAVERRRRSRPSSVGFVCAIWFVAGVYGFVVLSNLLVLRTLLAH